MITVQHNTFEKTNISNGFQPSKFLKNVVLDANALGHPDFGSIDHIVWQLIAKGFS